MGEFTKIEWTDHTFNPLSGWLRISPQGRLMREPMATLTKGDAVARIESEVGEIGERADVVGVEIATVIVSAVRASKSVPPVNVIAPSLQLSRVTKASAFHAFAVDVTGGVRPTRHSLACLSADLRSRLVRVSGANSVARPGLRRSAHLGAALFRHSPPLHWRNEGRTPLLPSLLDDFAAGQSHG